MKTASAGTLVILASGQYLKFEFYRFTLADGTVLRFTNADVALTVAGDVYQTGLTILRTGARQKMGLAVQELDLEIWPQDDHPSAPITVGGYPFLRAVNLGVFDFARVLFSKGFFNAPILGALDTSPGLVPWVQGKVNKAVASRSRALMTVGDDTQQLNVAMPRNLVQTGCVHSLFGTGCGLSAATFQVSGTVSGTPTVLQFNTGLTNPTGYFDQGRITFTSGANSGLRRTVKAFVNSSGVVTLVQPLPVAPTAGDTFTILPGCPKTQSACSNSNAAIAPAFNNLVHFRGFPFVPVPETLYDGGTPAGAAPTIGSQGGAGAGSNFTGAVGRDTYEP